MIAPDLAGFLLGVYDQIEATAQKATGGPWFVQPDDLIGGWCVTNVDKPPSQHGGRESGERSVGDFCTEADAAHLALHDSAFVLADIAAKRAAVGLHKVRGRNILGQPVCASCSPLTPVPCSTLLALAQPYRGWPGWRDEWETGR